MFTEMILDKLGVYYEDIAKPSHGSCPQISFGVLIDRIIEDNNTTKAQSLFPELGVQTFNRMMHKHFDVKLAGGEQTWFFYLLSIIEHKLCTGCDKILPFLSFSKDKNNSSIGLSSICKECRVPINAAQYQKPITKAAHNKSYIKHSAEIKARQQLYKGQRSLRVPNWYSEQKLEIEQFYRNCPDGYHVDHIIPLKGDLVSGLHVIQNLQYLTIQDNLAKGNKFAVS